MTLALSLVAPAQAQDQAVERPVIETPPRAPVSLRVDEIDSGEADTTPLGVDLAGVLLIGRDEAVSPAPGAGIGVGDVPEADEAAISAALSPFLGRPLSLALIAEMQASVASVWRARGYPFVSVTIPPQEITDGVLQLRLIEFRMGQVEVTGTGEARGERLRSRLRAPSGERIEARALEEDLDWLNRVPNRRVAGVFAPGDELGLSDLTLHVDKGRPLIVHGGWSNTGSRATDRNRFFVGGAAWLPELNDTTIAYQVTGSPDLWRRPARMVPRRGAFARYLGHSARIVVPTLARQAIEFSPGLVASRERADAFTTFENTTVELPVIYRSAVSNLVPGHYLGDVYGGVEFKRLSRTTYFAGQEVARGNAGLFQIVLGWTHRFSDRFGATSIDARLKANPGGVVSGNDAATWNTFTGGRVSSTRYAYGMIDIARTTRLPMGLAWASQASLLLAGQALPDTERLALGGLYATRGYGIDDATVDTGFFLRNELRLPALSPLASAGTGMSDLFRPFLFADIGHGRDRSSGDSTTIAGIGAGFDYDIGAHASATLAAGYALRDAARTERGDWNVQLRLVGRF